MASGGIGEAWRVGSSSAAVRSTRSSARHGPLAGAESEKKQNTAVSAAFLAKEEEYKRLNAELEAKTAELVRQAEEVMRDQQETLSRPVSAQVEWFDEEAKHQSGADSSGMQMGSDAQQNSASDPVCDTLTQSQVSRFHSLFPSCRDLHSPELPTLPFALNKQPNKKSSSVLTVRTRQQTAKRGKGTSRPCDAQSSANVAVPDFSLAKTIVKIEGQLEDGNLPDLEDDIIPGAGSEIGTEAQNRFLKAKLRVMKEELDAIGQECSKKPEKMVKIETCCSDPDIQFVLEVQRRPCLYDTYADYKARQNAWQEIAKIFNQPVNICQGKWRDIRDKYVRAYKKIGSGADEVIEDPTWTVSSYLSFLNPCLRSNRTTGQLTTFITAMESPQTSQSDTVQDMESCPTVKTSPECSLLPAANTPQISFNSDIPTDTAVIPRKWFVHQNTLEKDDENRNLNSQLKDTEEERGRLQRTASLQQSQIEKYKMLSEEANRKSEGLHQQLSMLEKELENLKRAQKQASASQGTMEVRLNRALEEAERYKMELNKLKQSNKDVVNQEHKKLEELKIENKRLEKQKGELMAGFKKQLKLIDILKRQKMHIEAAKMLSFTEEEFMKALEWGNS